MTASPSATGIRTRANPTAGSDRISTAMSVAPSIIATFDTVQTRPISLRTITQTTR
jgi:hypothetical protein